MWRYCKLRAKQGANRSDGSRLFTLRRRPRTGRGLSASPNGAAPNFTRLRYRGYCTAISDTKSIAASRFCGVYPRPLRSCQRFASTPSIFPPLANLRQRSDSATATAQLARTSSAARVSVLSGTALAVAARSAPWTERAVVPVRPFARSGDCAADLCGPAPHLHSGLHRRLFPVQFSFGGRFAPGRTQGHEAGCVNCRRQLRHGAPPSPPTTGKSISRSHPPRHRRRVLGTPARAGPWFGPRNADAAPQPPLLYWPRLGYLGGRHCRRRMRRLSGTVTPISHRSPKFCSAPTFVLGRKSETPRPPAVCRTAPRIGSHALYCNYRQVS